MTDCKWAIVISECGRKDDLCKSPRVLASPGQVRRNTQPQDANQGKDERTRTKLPQNILFVTLILLFEGIASRAMSTCLMKSW